LIEQLRNIWNFDQDQENKGKVVRYMFPVGLFTTENRKTWFYVRQNLLKSLINKQCLRSIEQALFVLCLDDASQSSKVAKEPSEAQQMARILHGSLSFSANRWYDKFMNVIIGSDGVCGLLTEHSASEGITVVRFAETFLKNGHNKLSNRHL